MKKQKKRLSYALTSILIIMILGVFLFYFSYEKDCGSNQVCFNEEAQKCSRAHVRITNNSTTFLYTIKGPEEKSCIINVKVENIVEPDDEAIKFIGKDMDCKIQKDQITTNIISDIPSLMQYCSGPLKETMYEVIIDKMYGTIAQNLGQIMLELREIL